MKCIMCGHSDAGRVAGGLACNRCGHRWTYEDEQKNAVFIRNVLGRQPLTLPDVVEEVVPEPVEHTVVFQRSTLEALTIPQLRDLAQEHRINLSGVSTKDAIIERMLS